MTQTEQKQPQIMHRVIAMLAILAIAFTIPTCFYNPFTAARDKKRQENDQLIWNLLIINYIYYLSNPCNFAPVPVLGSAMHTSGSLSGVGSFQGKILSATGAPVVGAVVLLDDDTAGDNVHYSTYSSLNRDGSFVLAGIPSADTYTLSVEPLDYSQFAQRIDLHLDCFRTPSSFTPGWYTGSGSTISAGSGGAATISVTANALNNLGTIRLFE